MSSYRFLADHSISQNYYQAGTTASTADVGGTLPQSWTPSNMVDPLDTAAVTAFLQRWPATAWPCPHSIQRDQREPARNLLETERDRGLEREELSANRPRQCLGPSLHVAKGDCDARTYGIG